MTGRNAISGWRVVEWMYTGYIEARYKGSIETNAMMNSSVTA